MHRLLPGCRAEAIAESCPPPAESPAASHQSPWKLGWMLNYAQVAHPFSMPDESFCDGEADLRLAATITLESLTRHAGRNLTGRAAIACGERIIERSFEEYLQQMSWAWKANVASVMFATLREGKATARVGVNVMFALTGGCQRRLYAGEMDVAKFARDDIAERNQYVLWNTVAESRAPDDRRAKARRGFANFHTGLYQLASLFLPVQQAEPWIVSVAGTAEGRRRLLAFGFAPIRVRSVRNHCEVMDFAPPQYAELGLGYPAALGEYLAMKAMIQIYQAYIDSRPSE